MSEATTISKLQALLARVQSRAMAPRSAGLGAAVRPNAVNPPAAAVAAVAAVPPARPAPSPAPAPKIAFDEHLEAKEAAKPVAPPAPPVRPVPARPDPEIAIDVDVQEIEEIVPEPLDSRERLVVAAPSTPEAMVAAPAAAHVPESEPAPEIVAHEEELEEEPASSRRPVAPSPEERLEEMAFGAAEPKPPRHTPPPESGRLPASPEIEFDSDNSDITGVRDAHPSAPVSIVPEATVAELPSGEEVPEIVRAAGAGPAPTTFLGVLDASIAL